MFDSIRLEVSEAFYSLPRGGAEIGGILLGKWANGKLSLSAYRHLACEHAFGPSFSLSPADRLRLTQLITEAKTAGEDVAGWYHSHTRSEIFLSEADLQIHAEFFPEPWQIAMVLRPHTLRPMRAGIFFRGAEGKIHSESAFQEIILEPLNSAAAAKGSVSGIPGLSPASQVVVDAKSAAEPSPAFVSKATPVPASRPVDPEKIVPPPHAASERMPAIESIPKFLTQEEKPWPKWPKITAILLGAAGLGAAAYWKRDDWMPRLMPKVAASGTVQVASTQAPLTQVHAGLAPPLGLNTVDLDGQLQIRWDRNSPAIQHASSAVLHIGGKSPLPDVTLDHEHLLSGVFTLGRQAERVEVAMDVLGPDGEAREATTYVGPLPVSHPAGYGAPAKVPANEEMLKQMRKLEADLDAEREHEAKLQKDIDFLAKQFREQRGRLTNQAK